MKKHIPNALTCANLVFGCIGLVLILQKNNPYWACYCVFLAGVVDFFDGFVARALKVSSAIGKELDSLADMVSFGVLPAVLLYHLLDKQSMEFPYIAFLIAVFSALRLAKFNIDTRQSYYFLGVPTPANAFFIASLVLNYYLFPHNFISQIIYYQEVVIFLVLFLSYLLVAEIPIFAFKFKNYTWIDNQFKYLFLLSSGLVLGIFQIQALPYIIMAYVILSILKKGEL